MRPNRGTAGLPSPPDGHFAGARGTLCIVAKSKSKARTPSPPKSAESRPTTKRSAPSGGRTAVEERWTEYWTRRQELEAAVQQVRVAREALDQALQAERELRDAFDETKRTLKYLLDVAPADSAAASAAASV